MNCQKCGKELFCTAFQAKPDSWRLKCHCGFASETLGELVAVSPAYRLARLKASGAAPGWYGPDGEKALWYWEEGEDDACAIVWHGLTIGGEKKEVLDTARLCGFVEVPNG